jgi:hypothetical protein
MKRRRYLSLKVGHSVPFHARIASLKDGGEIEPPIEGIRLESIEDVRGFLKVVKPICYIEKTALNVATETLEFATGPVESVGVLLERAVNDLESNKGYADFLLAPIGRAEIESNISTWKRTPAL